VLAYSAYQGKQAAQAASVSATTASASATDKATRLLAYKLIQASDDVLLTDRKLALMLAIEAYNRDQSISIRRRIFAASGPSIRTGGQWGPIVAATGRPRDDAVATASDDGAIRIWLADGQLDRVLTADDTASSTSTSCFRPIPGVAVKDGSMCIWSRDGKKRVPIEPGAYRVLSMGPKDELLAVASQEGLAVYDVSGKAIVPWTEVAAAHGIFSIPGPYFSPDGARLATATKSGIHLLTLAPSIKAFQMPPTFVRSFCAGKAPILCW